jgi:hypothetical protein
MIEKTTKSGSRVGIALVGAFATIAGIGEILVGLTGNYLGILAHPAGARYVGLNRTDCRSDTCSFSEATALKMTARHFDRLRILRRRFGTIKQTQVKRRCVSKKP